MDRGQRKGGTETHCGDTHEDTHQDVEGSGGRKRKENAKLERTPKDPAIFPSAIDISGILLKSLPILGRGCKL